MKKVLELFGYRQNDKVSMSKNCKSTIAKIFCVVKSFHFFVMAGGHCAAFRSRLPCYTFFIFWFLPKYFS
ncbi:MAG: hypothetical protein LBC02_06395 [Planctomycetaceae bacterium]|nr:hypothetical protein [Planctomycetaceae bacterium]